jgi:glycosyltransferase involved in cell wall biosynthesis
MDLKNMRILLLTFYFEPDLCAGSFRITAFIKSLKEKLGPDDRIDIITTMPNRYVTFTADCLEEEQLADNIFVKRINIPVHKSRYIDQVISFTYFFIAALFWTRKKKYDLIFATTSRLFTGFLGAVISKIKKIPLYLDVRDIFTDTMDSLLPKKISFFILPIFKKIEKITFRRAIIINMVSEGFKDYIKKISNKEDLSYFTNGIDDEFLKEDFSRTYKNKIKIITYAGNIGQGQGLDKIIPEMAEGLGNNYLIKIYGDGGIRDILEREILDRNIKNVIIEDPVDRKRLLEIYRESDWLFLHLNAYDAFKKVLPSKIFEYAATEKPIIAGVEGYSADFIKNNLEGAIVFQPCEAIDFLNKFKSFNDYNFERSMFINNFKRETIMSQMADEVLKAGRSYVK